MAVGDDELTLTMRVQDHATYKAHNALMQDGRVAVTDELPGAFNFDHGTFADVPATTD